MTEQVRVGLVGTSWWSETFHLAGLASHPRAEITAICGRDRARAEQLAERHGSPTVFTDHREMMSSGLLDAVVIATPDDTHRSMALDAIANRLHVLCEKPLARSANDAREMLDAAQAVDRVHMVMFTWRWLGIFAYLHTLIEAGYLGHCRDAHFAMYGDYASDPTYNWRFDPRRGSGIVGDFGSHMIDLARWYLGDITQVSARLISHGQRARPDGAPMTSLDDSASLIMEFGSGAHGTIDVSGVRLVGELPSYRVGLYGDEGSLEADVDVPTARLRVRRRADPGWTELVIPADLSGTAGDHPAILGFPLLAPLTNLPVGDRLFIDAVLGDNPAEPTFEDGWRAQQVVDAAVLSNRERRWISVG